MAGIMFTGDFDPLAFKLVHEDTTEDQGVTTLLSLLGAVNLDIDGILDMSAFNSITKSSLKASTDAMK